MTVEHTFHSVFRSPSVSIGDFRCRARDLRPGRSEHSTECSIVFVRSGLFVRHVGRRAQVADPNQILFFQPGEDYRVSHPVAGGDQCTVIAIEAGTLREIIGRQEPAVLERPERPFAHEQVPCPTNLYLLHRRLLRELQQEPDVDSLVIDETSLTLGARVMDWAYQSPEPESSANRRTERAHGDWVHAVRIYLSQSLGEVLTLDRIARNVCCSPYHLSRLFRRKTGLPIHRYRDRLRLRAALDRLAEGAKDITEVALGLGYSSHSHLADSFRREFGMTPSRFRREVNLRRLREMSKNLEV